MISTSFATRRGGGGSAPCDWISFYITYPLILFEINGLNKVIPFFSLKAIIQAVPQIDEYDEYIPPVHFYGFGDYREVIEIST